VAIELFPTLFFDPDTEYIAILANTPACVFCSSRSLLERSVLALGVWEEEDSAFLDRTVREGWTVLDIGANVGIHTCRLASLVGSHGRVIAFEPNSEVRDRMCSNIHLNGFENVKVEAYGISDAAGVGSLYVNAARDPNRNATLVRDRENPEAKRIPVNLQRLDDYWLAAGAPRVHFMKIDIEGYEFAALRSGEQLIKTCSPIVLSEYSQYFANLLGYSWEDLKTWYSMLGYGLFSVEGKPVPSGVSLRSRTCFDYVARRRD
jgi:FkbM family methyltransferase